MKASGINYFNNLINLDTGIFKVFYTFEENAGTTINSVSGGQPLYTGVLNTLGEFWNIQNSGFISGNHIEIKNGSGLESDFWTQIFVYEKLAGNDCFLYDSKIENSGYRIGINDANRVYLEGSVLATSENIYSSKNIVAVSYAPNSLSFGYYNPVKQKLEVESFNQTFEITRSDNIKLFSGYTGYIDYYLYFNTILTSNTLESLLSGLFYRKTGVSGQTEIICENTITGYQNVTVYETGITGYFVTPFGNEGRDFYIEEFPVNSTTTYLTGIISSRIVSSGLTGQFCYTVTGENVDILEFLSGYATTFGMDKAILEYPIDNQDIVKYALNRNIRANSYNIIAQNQTEYFVFETNENSGVFNPYLNGLANTTSGIVFRTGLVTVVETDAEDSFIFDRISGIKESILAQNSGQLDIQFKEVFLNGINLISGHDFIKIGNFVSLLNNTGFTGVLFTYPNNLSFATGNLNLINTTKFARNGSVFYINGLRQLINSSYFEGANIDKLLSNSYNYLNSKNIYDGNELNWE